MIWEWNAYPLQVPANGVGLTQFHVGQLKIMQEVITLAVFVPFAVFSLDQPLKQDYLWAGLCQVGAVYFIFRGAWGAGCNSAQRFTKVLNVAQRPVCLGLALVLPQVLGMFWPCCACKRVVVEAGAKARTVKIRPSQNRHSTPWRSFFCIFDFEFPPGASMLFAKLLPREGNFFEMFNQHADRIVEAARAFSQLVANYNDPHLRDKYNQDVDNAERAADRVTHDVNKAIHKTFITPIDREQIHALINTMDDVADLIQDSAETMALYDVRHMTEEITRLTDLSLKCCERVRDAVKLLDKIADPAVAEAALKTCEEIDRLESDADRVMRSAMSKLFREEPDVREVIKLKAIYELLETITDKCEDVANCIEGIVLENS